MREAFSMIELIFVIVIIGILSAIGTSYFKNDTLKNDVDYILNKIKQTRFEAIGYNKCNFNGEYKSDSIGCIELDKDKLNGLSENYQLKSTIDSSVKTLCFDYVGRPHDGIKDNNETNISSLLSSPLQITINYNIKSKKIVILPFSGYAQIVCN